MDEKSKRENPESWQVTEQGMTSKKNGIAEITTLGRFVLGFLTVAAIAAVVLGQNGTGTFVNSNEKMVSGSIVQANAPVTWPNAPFYTGPVNGYAQRGYGGQCTAFAYGRAMEVTGSADSLPSRGDANTWLGNVKPGTEISKNTPRANSIAVWEGDSINTHGHVAFVEDVVGTTVYLSEANVEKFKQGNFGGGYDGYIKQRTLSQMAARGKGIGKILGYIYLPLPAAGAAPSVTAINPPNPQSGLLDQDIVVSGSNFRANLTVATTLPSGQSGPLLSGSQIGPVSSGFFTIHVTLGTAGTWKFRVINQDNTQSDNFSFAVHAPNTPAPAITSISPTTLTAGSGNQNLAISGTNFQPNLTVGVVFPSGQPGPVLLGAQINNLTSTSFTLSITLGASGPWTIRVINPDGGQSMPFSFNVQPPNSSNPTISSISPATGTVGGNNQTLIVSGANFQQNLRVAVFFPGNIPGPILSGTQIPVVSSTSFTMLVTLGSPGAWGFRVINPDGSQGTIFQYTVQQSAQQPTISAINPAAPVKGSTDQDITVSGTNFAANLTVTVIFPGGLQGPTLSGAQITNVTSTSFMMKITLGTTGAWAIRVNNLSGSQSSYFSFQVVPPTNFAPVISSMNPASPLPTTGNQNVTVTGNNFQANLNVVVRFPNGQGAILSGTQITNVTATSFEMIINFSGVSGNYSIQVVNPDDGTSNIFPFSVQAAQPPSISSISPSSPIATIGNQNVIVNGSNFVSGLTVTVTFPNGMTGTLSGSQIGGISSTSFTMAIDFNNVSGSYSIRVNNPGGSQSNTFGFTVQPQAASPSISSISPSSLVATVGNQIVTVNGSNFVSGLTVTVTFPNGTTGTLSGSQIGSITSSSFEMAIDFNNIPGTYCIKVKNPGGAQSANFCFTVLTAIPSISSISPSSPVATVGSQNVTVNGQRFVSGLTVTVTFPNGNTGTLSGSQIGGISSTSFTMAIDFNNVPGSYSLRVNNPGGAQSNSFGFTVQSQPSPSITSIFPSSPVATVGNQNVTVNGGNFVSGLTVTVTFPNGTTGTLSGSQIGGISSTSFTMAIDFNNVPGSYSIRVNNPGGAQSNNFGFTVQTAVPLISSISPASPPRTAGNQNVTVNGQRFVTGLTVTVTFPNGTTGTLSGSQIVNLTSASFTMVINFNNVPGAYSIRVNNPGGAQSNSFGFNVQ